MLRLWKQTLMFIALMIVLAACSSISADELLDEALEAHDEVEAYQLEFKEKIAGSNDKGTFLADKSEEEYEIQLGKEERAYINKDAAYIEEGENAVEVTGEELHDKFLLTIDFFNNPFDHFSSFDKGYAEFFDVEEEDDEIHFTLKEEVDEDDLFDFAEAYIEHSSGNQSNLVFDVNDFSMDFKLDSETKRLSSIKIKVEIEENGEDITFDQSYTLSNYNDIDEIIPIEVVDVEDVMEDGGEIGEAVQFLDALIQATVYQDEKEAIKRAPDSMSKKEKEDGAAMQKKAFRDFYIENTKNNMAGLDITDKDFDRLADSFLEGISKAKYEMVDVEEFGGEVIVTLQIEGIDGATMSQEIQMIMMEELDGKDFTEEEMFQLNFDLLVEGYKDIQLAQPVEVEVRVSKVGDDFIVDQDEYLLGGFVQE